MPKLVIDARSSGTSTGRYIDKLIEHLHGLKPGLDITILTHEHQLDYMSKIAPDFTAVRTDVKDFSLAEQLQLKKQIEALKPDLVHFAMTQQPVWYRGRAVTTIHDLTSLRFPNPSKNPVVFMIKQNVFKWVTKRVARKSERIITPTEYVKKDVAQYTGVDPGKISVTLEAADMITEPAEAVKELGDKPFILYVGRPNPHKNLDRLVDAFARLQTKHPDLQLALAGKTDALYEKLKQNTNIKGIKNVRFLGFMSEGQLRWLYSQTSAYVFTSLSEGFGLPPLEAMLHGAPVVSSNASCMPEVYGPAAEYFDPMNIEGIAAAVENVIGNPKRRQELMSLGQKHAAQFSWSTTAQQTFDIYKQLLQI